MPASSSSRKFDSHSSSPTNHLRNEEVQSRALIMPSIAIQPHSAILDALSTHESSAVRVAVSIFVSNFKPPIHASRLAEAISKLLRGLELLASRDEDLRAFVTHELNGIHLLREVTDLEVIANPPLEQPVAVWIKQHPIYGALIEIPEDDHDSLIAIATAYVLGQHSGKQIDATFARLLVRESASSSSINIAAPTTLRKWHEGHLRNLHTLRAIVRGTNGETDAEFQRDACSHLLWRSKLPGRNDRAGVVHDRCLTPAAFKEATTFLRIGLVDGDGLASAICSGWLSGLTWPLVKRIPLHKPEGENWVIWLDVAAGCFRVNLNPVVRNAALAKGNPNYIEATKQYERNLPAEVADCLRKLAVIRPDAAVLSDLTATQTVPEEHAIGESRDHVLKPSIARFFNTRSSASKLLGLSGPITALAIGETARVAHSRLFYFSTTLHQLDDALERVANLLGWGTIRSTDSKAQAIGANVVPSSEVMAAMARELASKVLATQPPKRYKWHHIRAFHNALAHYVAFLIGLGVLGRNREASILVGALSSPLTGLVGLHDKKTPSSIGATQVAVCRQLRDQLAFWFTHLRCLLARIDKCGQQFHVLQTRIQAILDGNSSSIVFTINDRNRPADLGTSGAYGSVSEGLQIKADSSRHFWEQFFAEEKIDDSLANGQSRRNVHWSDYWQETTHISGARLRRVIGTLQERVLRDLGISAIKGLVK